MPKKVLPEWSGENLTYISPPAALAKFGFMFGQPPTKDRERGIQYNNNVQGRVPLQDGEVAKDIVPFRGDGTPTEIIKQKAKELGADLVGIAVPAKLL